MMSDFNVSGLVNTSLDGVGQSDNSSGPCVDHDLVTAARMHNLSDAVFYVTLALGVPGNLLSAIVWLRRHIISKNTSAIYLAALAVNDLAFQTSDAVIHFVPYCFRNKLHCSPMFAVFAVAMICESLLVLAFSVERLIAVLRPLQVERLPRVIVTFYFRLQISISGCRFCSQLMNLWKLLASRFHLSTCQPGHRSEYIHACSRR